MQIPHSTTGIQYIQTTPSPLPQHNAKTHSYLIIVKKRCTLQDRFLQEKKISLGWFDFHLVAEVTKCYNPPELNRSLGKRKVATALKVPHTGINKEHALRGCP